MKILLLEDDEMLANGLAEGLRQHGHQVDAASTARAAQTLLNGSTYEVLLLDLGLPDFDGMEFLRRTRQGNTELFVVVLTGRESVDTRVRALDLGADDYLIKPIALTELEARLRAIARRRCSQEAHISNGPLVLDTSKRTVTLADRPMTLSSREWDALELLVRNTGELIHKERIVNCFGGSEGGVSSNAVEVYICRLRAKLEPDIQIRTVRGYGYLLVPAEGRQAS